MNPGATHLPCTSTRRTAVSRERSPTAVIRSPVTPTSARKTGAPLPSATEPPARIRSNRGASNTGTRRNEEQAHSASPTSATIERLTRSRSQHDHPPRGKPLLPERPLHAEPGSPAGTCLRPFAHRSGVLALWVLQYPLEVHERLADRR